MDSPLSVPALADFRRIVIKVGSALLVDRDRGRIRLPWLYSLVEDIGVLHRRGCQVMVVSSGSVGMGRTMLDLPPGQLKLEDGQAAAAVGQVAISRTWAEALAYQDIKAGQVLLTLGDTEERRRYLNARSTLKRLMKLRAVPIINENDTVATNEIRYGDNDRLAARVATMASADLLILLSDIDGLYTAPPALNPKAEHIPVVPRISAEIEAMAGAAASELSRGGMFTKIEAGKIATAAGTHMLITTGHVKNPLRRIQEGGRCTWFLSSVSSSSARKSWIAGALEPHGTLHLDKGAVEALRRGASLLPAGIRWLEGDFQRGDAVILRGPDGGEVGRGLVAYDAPDAERIIGHPTSDIEQLLGIKGRSEMVHRDDMALSSE
ncbi:glutamate 5-kinase [Xanthobacter sp. TB0139]|uniref:glutamate 5-kinase n=1 Tax=Xanthobacter sp. TB0139 TaxID=3459178 RepID=UPI00403A1635